MGRHDGGRHYVGWRLDRGDRARLLALIPPRYPRILADHVTLRFGVTAHASLPGAREGVTVGLADDGAGVQALVVEIGGTVRRPDGGTYHITWPLAPDRRPVESNEVIRRCGWAPRDRRTLALEPALLP